MINFEEKADAVWIKLNQAGLLDDKWNMKNVFELIYSQLSVDQVVNTVLGIRANRSVLAIYLRRRRYTRAQTCPCCGAVSNRPTDVCFSCFSLFVL